MGTGSRIDRRDWPIVRRPADSGFVMVALLVAMAVTAVWMGQLLPAWRQQVMREREAELIYRGEQYARAIYLYRQRNNQVSPPTIDALVQGHYLRKKYLDPITGKEFLPLGGLSTTGGGGGTGGITGVRSTSNDTSIVVYKSQQVYSQFPFDWAAEAQKAGAGGNTITSGGRQQGTGTGQQTGQGGGRPTGPGGGVQTPRGGQAPPRGQGPGGAQAPGGGRVTAPGGGGRF